MQKSWSGSMVPTHLTSPIVDGTDETFQVAEITDWPNPGINNLPFVITIDPDTATEEAILCASYSGTTVTVFPTIGRGWDGTTPQHHDPGVDGQVIHTLDADTIQSLGVFAAGVGTVTPQPSAVGDAAAKGNSGVPADAAHKHAREQFGSTVVASEPSDTGTVGEAPTPARSDHQHPREGYGTTASNSAVTDSESAGMAATVARSDHVHGREGFGTPGTSAPGDTAAQGMAATVARSDHVHGREAAPTGVILAYKQIVSPNYNANTGTYACIDSTNAILTFTAPKSGNVLLQESSLFNVGSASEILVFQWSQGTTNNSGLIGHAVRTGSLVNGQFLLLEHVITGLTPGQSYTVALQWAYAGASGGMNAGNGNTDLVLKALSL